MATIPLADEQDDSDSNHNMASKLTPKDWDQHRGTIIHLYAIERHPLKTVKEIMAKEHSFYATERMFKARLKSWKIRKNCTTKEIVKIMKLVKDRADAGKPHTSIRLRGMEVDHSKFRKFRARKGQNGTELLMETDTQSRTPSDISCFTPRHSPKPSPTERSPSIDPISRHSPQHTNRNFRTTTTTSEILDLRTAQIDPLDFITLPIKEVSDPQMLLVQEMSTTANAYFENYFDSTIWKECYAPLSVNFEGDEIVDVAKLGYPSEININASTSVFDFTNPGTLVTLYETACLLLQRGDQKSADRLIDQAKGLMEGFFQNEHPQLLGSLFLVVCILEARERMDLVTGLLNHAQWKARTIFGDNHPIPLMISCCSRASTLRQPGAAQVWGSLIDTFHRLIGPNQTFTLRLKQLYAWSLFQQGQHGLALSELRKVQRIYENLAGDDHLHSRHALYEIAQILTAQNELEEAEETFRRVYTLAEKKFGRDPPMMLNFECMRMLAVIYRRQAKRDKVLSTLCHTLPLGNKILGEEHPTMLLIKHELKKLLG